MLDVLDIGKPYFSDYSNGITELGLLVSYISIIEITPV